MQVCESLLQKEQFIGQDTDDTLHFAFAKRLGTHARAEDFLLPEDCLQEAWEEKICLPGEARERSAYLHIPFCRLRCTYCGFYKNHHEPLRSKRYVQTLIKDIKMSGQKAYCHEQPLKAVYFGGGTPGIMTPQEITQVLAAVKSNLTLADDCEITFETSVCDLDDEQFSACLAGGVNRFSLGVQTFNTKIRQSLGRIDDEKRLRARLEELSTKQDQAAIVIDLIYGLPGQTLQLWQHDLDLAIGSGIHGLDTYSLNVQSSSILAQQIKEGKMPAVAPRHEQADYFANAVETLHRNGLRRLSVCHWGRFDMKEQNVYNRMSKGAAGKIPFGAGAGGSLDGWRLRLCSDAEVYEQIVNEGKKPIQLMARPSALYPVISSLKACMDQGVLLTDNLPQNIQAALRPLLHKWEQRGFINSARGINELTLAGQFWYGELSQALVDYVQVNFYES